MFQPDSSLSKVFRLGCSQIDPSQVFLLKVRANMVLLVSHGFVGCWQFAAKLPDGTCQSALPAGKWGQGPLGCVRSSVLATVNSKGESWKCRTERRSTFNVQRSCTRQITQNPNGLGESFQGLRHYRGEARLSDSTTCI